MTTRKKDLFVSLSQSLSLSNSVSSSKSLCVSQSLSLYLPLEGLESLEAKWKRGELHSRRQKLRYLVHDILGFLGLVGRTFAILPASAKPQPMQPLT